jgi:NAD(P)-dependent dehydrogenase (short-subunit alcohol dehydrogenase family)
MSNDLKIALVTGANKGIGFSTVKQLLSAGYHVYLGARDKKKGQTAIDQLGKEGYSNVSLLELDVTDKTSIKNAVATFAAEQKHLDVLVNNSGIGGQQPQQTSTIRTEQLKEVFETNYFGAVRVTQAFLPFMHRSKFPRIVNVSSELGSLAFHAHTKSSYNSNNLMAYSTTKVALNSFTILLANELQGTPFKINSVTPGYTATDLTSFSGGSTPDEAARVIVKYATLDIDGPTGQFFSENGRIPW